MAVKDYAVHRDRCVAYHVHDALAAGATHVFVGHRSGQGRADRHPRAEVRSVCPPVHSAMVVPTTNGTAGKNVGPYPRTVFRTTVKSSTPVFGEK